MSTAGRLVLILVWLVILAWLIVIIGRIFFPHLWLDLFYPAARPIR